MNKPRALHSDVASSLRQTWIGYAAVLLSAGMLGAGGAVTKYMYSCGIPPLYLLKIRLLAASAIFFVALRFWKREALKIDRSDILPFALLGMVGFGGCIGCAMTAVKLLNVGLAVFLQYLAPSMIVLYLWMAKRQRPRAMVACAVGVALVGGLLMLLGRNLTGSGGLGILIGLASAALYAFITLWGKRLSSKYGAYTTVFYSFLFAAGLWILLPPYQVPFEALLRPPLWMHAYVIFCYTVFPYGLFFVGMHQLPPANVAVTASTEPVIASVVAYLMLGESLSAVQIAGAVLAFLAVLLLQKESGG